MAAPRRERLSKHIIQRFTDYGIHSGNVARENADLYRANGIDPSNALASFRRLFPDWRVLDDRIRAAYSKAYRQAYAGKQTTEQSA